MTSSAPKPRKKSLLLRYPLLELLASMRFAVALLSILGIASVVGTVLPQNRPMQDYVFEFGPFWAEIFRKLGLYDVYASGWFVAIMLFLSLSTALCLWRNIPPFMREMRSFREKITAKSLSLMPYSQQLCGSLKAEIAEQYLQAQGFRTRRVVREDGVLVAAKKGSLNKVGYILAHTALIVICLGGLIDSNLMLKAGILAGRIVPDKTAESAGDFPPQSRLGAGNLSFRGNVTLAEGQRTEAVFLDAGNGGYLLQELPFTLTLKKFHIDYYDNGMPSNFASDIEVTDKKSGAVQNTTIRVNHPLTVNGVTIYQSSFGDGGSLLNFAAWDLAGTAPAAPLALRSMSEQAFPLGNRQYRLSVGELKPINVEPQTLPESADGAENTQKRSALGQAVNDVRTVQSDARVHNVGASISYTLRDEAGQNMIFANYMMPREENGRQYYFSGFRRQDASQFRWVGLPADTSGSLETFMLLRRAFADPAVLEAAAARDSLALAPGQRAQYRTLSHSVLKLFAHNAYEGIDQFVQTQIAPGEQQQMGRTLYQVLASSANQVLTVALENAGREAWESTPERAAFVLDSLQGMAALRNYPAPVWLQLDNFDHVQASGLQMTRSPGEYLVYLGSFLMTLGAVFMFYLREKRAWILINGANCRFAMSANRHKSDLEKDFPRHRDNLERLIREL